MGAIFYAVIMVLAFVWGAHEFIRYRTGTPTTATVTQCSVGRGGHCEGTWTIGGVPQHGNVKHGYIFGAPPVGSTMEVRVNGGTAYTGGRGYRSWGSDSCSSAFRRHARFVAFAMAEPGLS